MLITEEELKRYSELDGEEQVNEALNITKGLKGKYEEIIDVYNQILNKTKPQNIEKIRDTFIYDIINLMKDWEKRKINLNVKNGIKNNSIKDVEDTFQNKAKLLLKQLITLENPKETEKLIQNYMKKFENEENYIGLSRLYVLEENPSRETFKILYQIFSDESEIEKYYEDLPEIETEEEKQKVNDNGIYWLTTFIVQNVDNKVFDDKEIVQMLIQDSKFDSDLLIEKLSEEQKIVNIDSIIKVISEKKDAYQVARFLKILGEKCQETNEFQEYMLAKLDIYFNDENISGFALQDIWKNLTGDIQEKYETNYIKYLVENKDNIRYLWEYTKENVQARMLDKMLKEVNEKYKEEKDGREYKGIIKDIWCGLSQNIQEENDELFWGIYEKVKGEFYYSGSFWQGTKKQERYFERIYQDMLSEADKEFFERKIEIESIWESTNENLQRKYLKTILQDFPEDISSIFRATNKNLQNEYFENDQNINDKFTVKLFMGLDNQIKQDKQNLFWKYVDNYIDNDFNLVLSLWSKMNFGDFQNNNFKRFYQIVKDKPDGIILFWRATKTSLTQISDENIEYILSETKNNEEVFLNIIKYGYTMENLLKNAMSIFENNFDMQIKIWEATNSYMQEKNSDWFNNAVKTHKENPQDIVRLWYTSEKDIQGENIDILDYLINECEITGDECTKILNHTIEEALTEDRVSNLIKKVDKENAISMFENYKILKEMNPKLNKTINLNMLKNDIVKFLGTDKLIKLSTDSDLQNNIVQNKSNKNFMRILKHVSDNVENWTLEINSICSNIKEYRELFDNIKNQELNEKQLKQLYLCLLQEKNWFKIKEIADLENYGENRKRICSEILEGNNIDEKLSNEFKNLTEDEKKIFAILELSYGMDISTAQNLVYKYGEDIEEIAKGKYKDEEAVKEIKVLKSLLELKGTDAKKLYQSNKMRIQNWNDIEYSAGVHIEEKALELYEKLYQEALEYDEEKREDVEYNGQKVAVSEIVGDFKFFIRVEGAYSDWEEPEDFSKYFDEIDPYGNGNCKSFIANNLFARARPKGPTFGYDKVINNSLLIMAPWDIISNDANYSFSTSSVKWNFNKGIQFRIPDKMVDTTRDNHNETVSKKWFWNEDLKKLERDKPNFVLYVKTKSDLNIEEDPQYKMSIKAAAQLKIPLKIIDMQRNIEREQNKIENYLKALTHENKTKMTEEEIIRKVIVDLENNRTAMRFADNELKQIYFTDEMREKVYDTICNIILEYRNTNPNKANNLQLCFEKAISDEIKKAYTNAEKITDSYSEKNFFMLKKAKLLNTRNIKKFDLDVYAIKDIKYELENVSKLKYYDDNRAHSIEHIERVVLFSALLAEMEGLNKEDKRNLFAAAAFHDSGRSGLDGNDEHARFSAIQTLQYLEENPKNPFGISKDNIGIIQTAIHYHEYREKEYGKIDIEEINKLAEQYNVRKKDILKTQKICELLKDADALDRFRFANKARLNPEFLRSKSARSNGMINFARNVNEAMAEQILKKIYNISEEEISKINKVKQLRYVRIEANKENPNYVEPHLPLSDLLEIINLDSNEIESNIKDNKKTEILMNWYKEYGVTKEDVENITRMFTQRVQENNFHNKKESEIEVK